MLNRQTKDRTCRESYPCELLGRTVRVTLEYKCHGPDFSELASFSCDGQNDCDVHKQGSPGFDWSKCVHPKNPRK